MELSITFGPFAAILGLACFALTVHVALACALSVLNGVFLLRLFAIQHDCGHRAFFRGRDLNDWTGRAIGVLTLTPYDVWRESHSRHHSASGNLDRRGTGDLPVLTVREYRNLPLARRWAYRIYRHPLFLFGVAPIYLFFIRYRLPGDLAKSGWRHWFSSMTTNAALALLIGTGLWFGGLPFLLYIFFPTTFVAASAGMWLFFVQHQFEDTYWQREKNWQVHDAALAGSSHYVLPSVLRWCTANIGAHHVHHLYCRIPFYRLPEVLRDHPALDQAQRLTLRESFSCARLHLWDENSLRLLSFAEARRLVLREV